MRPRHVLELVRHGYVLATPPQASTVRRCREADVQDSAWVPRWALEAEVALESAGYQKELIGEIFEQGRSRILGELALLVRARMRSSVFISRKRWVRSPIDGDTEEALRLALRTHSESCVECVGGEPCLERQSLDEELELLFPADRRRGSRR